MSKYIFRNEKGGYESPYDKNSLMKLCYEEISDLEAKLAEKEERIKWLVEAEWNRKWANKYVEMRRKEEPKLLFPDSDEVYQRYFELKQQLAEKDEQLKELTECNQYLQIYRNQDEISFAVEQLEQIKKFYNEYDYAHNHTTYEVLYQLDRRIKQLKEMK